MKKLDSLLKKVEVFEKLALYGDRKSFLQAIAQINPSSINANQSNIVSSINTLNMAIKSWIKNDSERQSDLPSGMISGLPAGMRTPFEVMRTLDLDKLDLDTLPKAYMAAQNLATVANLGDMGESAKEAWLNKVFPVATNLVNLIGKELQSLKQYRSENTFPEMPSTTPEAAGNSAPSAPQAPAKSYPSIPRDVQEKLSRIVSIDGIGLPLKRNDGILGPETRAALDNFKQKYNVPGNFDDSQVFDVIRGTFARNQEKYQ